MVGLYHLLSHINLCLPQYKRGCHGHDRMVVGFTTAYAISAYHHWSCEFESCSGKVYSIQHYVIKFVSGHLWQVSGNLWQVSGHLWQVSGHLWQVSGFLWLLYTTLCDKVCQWSFVTGQWFSLVTPVFSSNKTATNRHDRTEILLKVVLNTINLNPNLCLPQYKICLTFPIY